MSVYILPQLQSQEDYEAMLNELHLTEQDAEDAGWQSPSAKQVVPQISAQTVVDK